MRRISRVAAVGVSVIGLMGIAALTAISSSAGTNGSPHHLVIDKAVEGPLPEGAEFRITFVCVQEGQIPDPQQVVINGPGNVVDASLALSQTPLACTVTEPVDGGAASVAFSCEASGDATCEADNRVVFDTGDLPANGAITVTNTFEEPAPPPEPAAEAITTEPAFTG